MYQKRNKELEVVSLYRGDYEKQFYLRQISKLSKIPLKTTQNTVNILEKNKIFKSRTEGKNKYFALNLDNIQAKSYLLQSEIYKTDVFLNAYPGFKTFLKSIDTNIPIIIFGSFARLKADKDSDVDVLVVSGNSEKQKLPFHLLQYKIHQVSLSEESFAKASKGQEALIKEIEENHIILNNHSFYVNLMWNYYGR